MARSPAPGNHKRVKSEAGRQSGDTVMFGDKKDIRPQKPGPTGLRKRMNEQS